MSDVANKDITKSFLLKFVLAMSSMAIMFDMCVYPAAETIYGVFAEENIVLVNNIITGSSLFVIIGSVLAGFVAQRVGKKTILATAYGLFCVFSACALFANQVVLLMLCRFGQGLCVGFIAISSAALIAELFVDEKTRSRLMGVYTGCMSVCGVLMSFAAGQLALINWHYVFLALILAVPIFVGVLFVVPKTEPEGKHAVDEAAKNEKTNWGRVAALVVAAFCINALYAVVLTFISVYLAEQGIGDVGTAGTMTSLQNLGSMIVNFTFGFIYMRLKRKTPIVFSIIMGIGFIILAFTSSTPLIAFACLFMGGMYGMSFTYFLTYASLIVPPSKISLSVGLVNAAVSAAMFVGPYVCPLFQMAFGVSTYATAMPYMGAACFIYAIISIILVATGKQRYAELPEQ